MVALGPAANENSSGQAAAICGAKWLTPPFNLRCSLQPIADGGVIPAFSSEALALLLSPLDYVLQTARAADGRLTAFSATMVSLHPHLMLPLPRNQEVRELV